jgi:uncharacterized protein (TIGR00251 family)
MNPQPWVLNNHQLTLYCHVQPGAKRTQITGLHDNCIKIQLKSPPVDGKANKALIQYLADICGCAKSSIIIKRGLSSRRKTLIIDNIDFIPVAISQLNQE